MNLPYVGIVHRLLYYRGTYACCVVFLTVYQSAKTNMNVEDVFFTIARDIKQRLAETDSKPEQPAKAAPGVKLSAGGAQPKAAGSSCCS